jgi:hypothetical protein
MNSDSIGVSACTSPAKLWPAGTLLEATGPESGKRRASMAT